MSAAIVRQCPHTPLHLHLQHSARGGKLNTAIRGWGGGQDCWRFFPPPLLSFHYCDSNAAWATEKKVGCQKIKCLIRRFGLYLQGSHLQVKCQGGGAHGGQRAMEVTCSHGTERGDSPGPGWHCPRLPCGYRTRVSAIILVSVHDDRVPREQLETSSPFLPFSRSINIESIANPPPPSQTSSPLPNSSSSKDEIEPCHSGNPFPLALSCEPLWSCVSSL